MCGRICDIFMCAHARKSPLTYAGSAGESNTGEAGCAFFFRLRCCCNFLSWNTWFEPWIVPPPPPYRLTCRPWGPTPCSHHGAYPVDRFGFGAAPCTGCSSPRRRRPLLRLPGVLGGERGERCKRGKGGRRGG